MLIFISSALHAGIEQYFKKAENKSDIHKMSGIDFIYMINLDRRVEKYERTMNALQPYGIIPYRFSAVHGWKLPYEAIDELGIAFFQECRLALLPLSSAMMQMEMNI